MFNLTLKNRRAQKLCPWGGAAAATWITYLETILFTDHLSSACRSLVLLFFITTGICMETEAPLLSHSPPLAAYYPPEEVQYTDPAFMQTALAKGMWAEEHRKQSVWVIPAYIKDSVLQSLCQNQPHFRTHNSYNNGPYENFANLEDGSCCINGKRSQGNFTHFPWDSSSHQQSCDEILQHRPQRMQHQPPG